MLMRNDALLRADHQPTEYKRLPQELEVSEIEESGTDTLSQLNKKESQPQSVGTDSVVMTVNNQKDN